MKITKELVTTKDMAVAVGVVAMLTAGSISAQALPKSGSINVHSGYWAIGEMVAYANKQHTQGHGNNRGSTFNDNGSGPLHLGPTDCFYTLDITSERTKVKGYCTFGDPDGDLIFTDFRGASNAEGYLEGMHDVDAGTGKYSGIQGSMTFKCRFSGNNGELQCTQRLDYKLP